MSTLLAAPVAGVGPPTIAQFSVRNLVTLSDLTRVQLRDLAAAGVFPPSEFELYRFPQVVGLRVIARLHRHYHVPLDRLIEIGFWLQDHASASDLWSGVTLWVARRVVYLERDQVPVGQHAAPLVITWVVDEMRQYVEWARVRRPSDIGQIERVRGVRSGDWVFAGTRMRVDHILSALGEGMSVDEVLKAYPEMDRRDIERAIEWDRLRVLAKRQTGVANGAKSQVAS